MTSYADKTEKSLATQGSSEILALLVSKVL